MLQNTYTYLWILTKSPSSDLSSMTRNITWHKWAIWINNMPKVSTGDRKYFSHNWTQAKRHSRWILRIYWYFRIAYDTFWVVFILKSIFGIFEIVFNLFYIRLSAISKRIYLRGVFIQLLGCLLRFWRSEPKLCGAIMRGLFELVGLCKKLSLSYFFYFDDNLIRHTW